MEFRWKVDSLTGIRQKHRKCLKLPLVDLARTVDDEIGAIFKAIGGRNRCRCTDFSLWWCVVLTGLKPSSTLFFFLSLPSVRADQSAQLNLPSSFLEEGEKWDANHEPEN